MRSSDRSRQQRHHRKPGSLSNLGAHLPPLPQLRQIKPRLTNTAMAVTVTGMLATGAVMPTLLGQGNGEQDTTTAVAQPAADTAALVAAPASVADREAVNEQLQASVAAFSLAAPNLQEQGQAADQRASRSQTRTPLATVKKASKSQASAKSSASKDSSAASKDSQSSAKASSTTSKSKSESSSSSKSSESGSSSSKSGSSKSLDDSGKSGSSDSGFSGGKAIPAKVRNLDWDAMAHCEATGNPKAYNPAGPYYGLYQFDMSTWKSVGGTGKPTSASAAEQTYRAQLLYIERGGSSAWPVCGKKL